MTNVFYFDSINSIGGIETFFYQLGKKYGKDYDITLFYKTGDPGQIKRLSKYINVRKYKEGQTIRCKRAFVCFNPDFLNHVEADEYYQMLHGDYTSIGVFPKTHPKLQKRVAVSEVVRDSYKKARNIDSLVCYNPFTPEEPKKVLNLVSATRLTREKGWNRMLALAEALDKAGVPFQWTVYTDNPNIACNNPSIILRPPRMDVLNFIANADYYVQLSDTEGYCYSIVEAMSVGTPVIVTDFKVAHEIGVVNGKNGWILPMSMQRLPIDDIYKGLKKFKYVAPEDKWDELLVAGDTLSADDLPKFVWVRCRKVYYDMEFERMMDYGEEWQCERNRADMLESLCLVDIFEE